MPAPLRVCFPYGTLKSALGMSSVCRPENELLTQDRAQGSTRHRTPANSTSCQAADNSPPPDPFTKHKPPAVNTHVPGVPPCPPPSPLSCDSVRPAPESDSPSQHKVVRPQHGDGHAPFLHGQGAEGGQGGESGDTYSPDFSSWPPEESFLTCCTEDSTSQSTLCWRLARPPGVRPPGTLPLCIPPDIGHVSGQDFLSQWLL